jgi:hypothetical protein
LGLGRFVPAASLPGARLLPHNERVDQHDLVSAVKSLAAELGQTPTRAQFERHIKGGKYAIERAFRSYSVLLQAAGLETYAERRKPKPLSNEIFERDIGEALSEYKPTEPVAQVRYTPTLIIPDTHFPFVNHRVLDAIYAFADKYKPEHVIQIGDLYDLYSHGRFPRSHNVYMPKEEEELGRKGAEAMWAEINRIVPKARKTQVKGNHDLRPLKQTLAVLPSLEHVVSKYLDELMTFPGVDLVIDPRQELIIEGVAYIHGHYSRLGQHRDFMLMNAVRGHDHMGGVSFKRFRGQTFWELTCGLAGDPESKALSYTPQRMTHWCPGFGFIDEYGPRFIPVG